MTMKPKIKKSAPPKKVTYAAVQRYEVSDDVAREMFANGQVPEPSEPYRLLRHLVGQYHEHLTEAKILLLWRQDVKPDRDGKLELGKCKKRSDAEKEAADHDLVITLNEQAWDCFKAAERMALLDHELCHAAVSIDEEGEVKRDTRGRIVYRIRKHDVEEFSEIIQRHGLWKDDLRRFGSICVRTHQGEMFGATTNA